jgi:archaellum component FlaC
MTGIKTGGRAKGTPNKTTADLKLLRENLNNIITNEINNLDIILNGLSNEKRLDYIIKLMPYVMPKLNNIEMTTEQDINLNVEPTDEQIKELKDLILRMEL